MHEVVVSLTDFDKLQAAGFIDRAAAGEGDIIEEDHLASVFVVSSSRCSVAACNGACG